MTRVPVLGVPIQSKALNGMDSLLSIAQMPAGIPVGTLAIGDAGAKNAALLAAAILANEDAALAARLPRLLDAGDVVMVKGSLGARMAVVVEAVKRLGRAAPAAEFSEDEA